MAPKKDNAAQLEQTALATTQSSALASSDLLDGFDAEFTGLEEAGASDFKVGTLMLNFGGSIDGDVPPKTAWVNTLSESIEKEPELTLLALHKSRQYQAKDGEGKRVTVCSSWDGKTGKTAEGVARPCAGCPDYEFRRVDGKATRNCGDVHNVAALHRSTGDVVMLRLKRTAIDPWKTFLNNTFLGKRVLPGGKRAHYPLFSFHVKLGAKIVDGPSNSKYAIPVFNVVRGEDKRPVVPTAAELHSYAETAKGVVELYISRPADFAEPEAAHTGDAIDTSATDFDFGANASERSADPYVDTSNRFG